eukprot:241572-Amphidinium_carterae.1
MFVAVTSVRSGGGGCNVRVVRVPVALARLAVGRHPDPRLRSEAWIGEEVSAADLASFGVVRL